MVPRKKLEVRKIHDVLRLNEQGLLQREIAQSLGCARSTVGDTLCRAEAAGLTYDAAQELSDAELYARLYPGNTGSPRRRIEPDYEYLHRELRRPGMTLQQLWIEYREDHPTERPSVLPVLPPLPRLGRHHRRGHAPAPPGRARRCSWILPARRRPSSIPIPERVLQAPVFCACLGASNYTYAEVLPAADLPSFLSAHVHMLEFYRRLSQSGHPRQSEGRGPAGLLLRARHQPELPGSRPPLRPRRTCRPGCANPGTRPRSSQPFCRWSAR